MNKTLRTAIQVCVSAALIGALVVVARRQHVFERLRAVPPRVVLLATGMTAAAWLVNSARWNLLLRVAGVRDRAGTLASLYFIGMFFSLLLPTSAGGDAVRMWDVARRRGKGAAVVVATLQERLLGMGVGMLVGLAAAAFFFDKLPVKLRPPLLGIPALAVAGVCVLLYPRIPFAVTEGVWGAVIRWGGARRIAERFVDRPVVRRVAAAVRPAADVPPLTPARLLPVVAVTLTGTLTAVGVYAVLGRAVGVGVPYGGYCLVVPLVWVVAMAPSVGGAGVREGAFVFLMKQVFDVPTDRSLTVAALYLIVQTVVACAGGAMLAWRVARGTWKPPPAESESEAGPASTVGERTQEV